MESYGVAALLCEFGKEESVSSLAPWFMDVLLLEPGVFLVSTVVWCNMELLLDYTISFRLYYPLGCPFMLLFIPRLARWSNVLSPSVALLSVDGIQLFGLSIVLFV